MFSKHRPLFALGLFVLLSGSSIAAEPVTAMAKAPADAEFYVSRLRMGETFELLTKTEAYKQLMKEPAVEQLRAKMLESMMGKDFEPVRNFLLKPENIGLPAMAADLVSNEVFFYAGAGTGDVLVLAQEIMGTIQFAVPMQMMKPKPDADLSKPPIRAILKLLNENPQRIKIPDLVFGFKVSDPAAVAKQLKRLDPLLEDGLKGSPLDGRVKREKVGDDEFLVLAIDGSLVPWNDIDLSDYEQKIDEFLPLIRHLKKMKLNIAIGVRHGYLMFFIGESLDGLAKFGNGPSLLSRKELEPVAKAAGKPMTAASYTSAKLRQAVATKPEDIQGYADMVKQFLGMASLPPDLNQAIEKDIDLFAKGVASTLVKPEATFAYSLRTKGGWETFDYDLTPAGGPTKKPLTLLDHVGGNPIVAAVWRNENSLEDFKVQVKWLTIVGGHVENVIRVKAPDAAPYIEKIRKNIYLLMQEIADITEKLWIPATADGQNAVVVDAKWKSSQWHKQLPKTPAEMPMLEFGIAMGVSDEGKLVDAVKAYRATLNKMIVQVREMVPQMPEFEIPEPKTETAGGRRYAWYEVPAEWGVTAQFQPTAVVGGGVAAMALSREHVDRLLKATPLAGEMSPLADRKKPLDGVIIVNFHELTNAVEPWVMWGMRQSTMKGVERDEAEGIAVKVFGYVKVIHTYVTTTWRDEKGTVTHSEMIFKDLPKK